MKPDIEVTDEMAKRVYEMYYANMPATDYISGVAAMKDALVAALNQQCKNCGKSEGKHLYLRSMRSDFDLHLVCPDYVFEPES